MTMFSIRNARPSNGHGHVMPIVIGGVLATAAVALVAYLLWPTWQASAFKGPERLPVSIGGTLFNVPTAAVRVKIQRHTGPQERVDLGFEYPSLAPPEAPHHVSADQLDLAPQPIDRIFVSISAHHDALSPEARLRTIYPRYLNSAGVAVQDGLTMRSFRAGTPYDLEDLFVAEQPALVTRCTRDAATPGMCLSERRVEGADLIFRFPRSWLSHWQDVAAAMERLAAQMHAAK
ncbi:hypothetical protein LQG66_09890 [Bradyrhizobium ontarionense]|uniref:Uncharacterized protein n=1 Tax=Bradyrhizobium ontarionense TaxID=2898149 RepID=A0ABY3RGJ7_9BRAD|nr:hypothetical protein [Bradyrhizobium sp. A19]UFZ06579.1 hypothetical protein LQG66_09890 [Bradyrhizobium sp. A19]